jgi:1-acyl-sn-glycerol-3-phosphate acyltransferase
METRARDPFYNIGPWAFLAYCLAKLIWMFPAALIFRQLGRVKGRETFPMDGPVLLLANHTAALDPVWLGFVAGRPCNYMASAALFRIRWLAPIITALGAFPKAKFTKDRDSMATLNELYAKGHCIMIFPEGTRTWDGRNIPVLPGIGRLVKRLNARVVFARMPTAFLTQPRWASYPRYVPLTVEFSPPITFEGKTEAEIVAAVNEGVRIDPELEVHGERCFGVRLAWGLPKYLWACPHCLAEESIVVSNTQSDEIHCRSCDSRWRIDVQARLNPLTPGLSRESVARAHDRMTDRLGPRPRFRDDAPAPILSADRARVQRMPRGGAPILVAEGALRLNEGSLSVVGEGGVLRWEQPLKEIEMVSLEVKNALFIRVAGELHQIFPEGQSTVKWGWFLHQWWILSRPEDAASLPQGL